MPQLTHLVANPFLLFSGAHWQHVPPSRTSLPKLRAGSGGPEALPTVAYVRASFTPTVSLAPKHCYNSWCHPASYFFFFPLFIVTIAFSLLVFYTAVH